MHVHRPRRFLRSTIFFYAVLFATIFIALQIVIIIFATGYGQKVMSNQTNQYAQNILGLCGSEIDDAIDKADRDMRQIMSNDQALRFLGLANDNARYRAIYSLKTVMNACVSSGKHTAAYMVADVENDVFIEERSLDFTYGELCAARSYIVDLNTAGDKNDSGWFMDEVDGQRYLMHYYRYDVIVLAVVDVESIWREYAALLKDGQALGMSRTGSDSKLYLTGDGLWLKTESPEPTVARLAISGTDFQLCITAGVSGDSLFDEVFPLLIISSCIVSLLFVAAFMLYMNHEVNLPVAKLAEATRIIERGDYEYRVSLKCTNEEFRMLAASLNSMLDMILRLRIEHYEQIIRYQDAELKYFYMQIQPHFFLNALSSLKGMSARGENKKIGDYVTALSRNIRYMFTAGLRRVPLREELEHVDDYIRCQEILYPGCVFSYIDAGPETSDWMIPQMLLHTFVENVYKHVVSVNSMVTLLLRAEIVNETRFGERDMLKLTIEDDGHGFSTDIISAFRSGRTSPEGTGNCVGLTNASRTIALMYGRSDLLYIENKQTGGGEIIVYLPEETVSERSEQNAANNS